MKKLKGKENWRKIPMYFCKFVYNTRTFKAIQGDRENS